MGKYLVIIIALFTALSAHAQTVNLSYAPAVGSTWTMSSRTVAKVPVLGTKTLELKYELTCTGTAGDNRRMKLHVPKTLDANGKPVGPVDATFVLTADGSVSSLQSPQLNDPQLGPLLRNVGMLFPKLPGGPVRVGATWTAREIMYLPAATTKHRNKKAARLPSRVRLDGTFTFKRLDPQKGAVISVRLKEASGEPIRVALTGEGFYDPERHHGTDASISGTIKVRKLLMWVTVPVSVRSWLSQ